MFSWSPLISSNHHDFMVKGTELAWTIIPGFRSRFALYEVRTFDADGYSDVRYRVRDAEKISDAEVREGKRPPIIWEGENYDKFLGLLEIDADLYRPAVEAA